MSPRASKEPPLWVMLPLFATQGLWARARTPRLPPATGPQSGRCGHGPSLRLLALGDSIIAGVGVESTWQALPASLADNLSRRRRQCVTWTAHGENGARTKDLLAWLDAHDSVRADLVVISNGINDLTSLLPLAGFIASKQEFYARLGKLFPGALLVQLGLPPLGSFPALPRPLRQMLGRKTMVFDAALGQACLSANVLHLPFDAMPEPTMFARDGYHPNVQGIRIWAEAVGEHIDSALQEASATASDQLSG